MRSRWGILRLLHVVVLLGTLGAWDGARAAETGVCVVSPVTLQTNPCGTVECVAGTTGRAVLLTPALGATITARCGGTAFTTATASNPVASGTEPNSNGFSCVSNNPNAVGYCITLG